MLDFLQNKSGATAIEYGLLIGMLSVAMLVALPLMGTDLAATFKAISDALAKT